MFHTSFDLCEKTLKGLKQNKYVKPTAIQKAALQHALQGKDVMGTAKTGSGKTLAFVLPILECLYREKWSPRDDGIGAIVLTPTRELALQIFEEIRRVGKHHNLSMGLLIGGRDRRALQEERARAGALNVIIATPGRLLQHMDETPQFDCGNMKMLVLDEADRILDMGFRATLDAIMDNLPKGSSGRQTLLFSATQTKSVTDLARLSLTDPEYISVHSEATTPTPLKLQQAFLECQENQKLSILWGFIKTHLKAKVLVFFSTCKMARFVNEAFSKLRPGVPLKCLHGHMKQMKRIAVYEYFAGTKEIVLFATDVASRGLDFPDVDWVIQFDCPEDVDTYIHRVGRTARYLSGGRSLLLLLQSEREGMLKGLQEKKVPVKQIKLNPHKHQDITQSMVTLLSKWPGLKEFAQSALTSYIKSIYLSPNKEVFKLEEVDVEGLSFSWGLANPPKLRFLRRSGIHNLKKQGARDEDGAAGDGKSAANASAPMGGQAAVNSEDSDSDEDDLLVVKRTEVPDAQIASPLHSSRSTSAAKLQKKIKVKVDGHGTGKRTLFDEDGDVKSPFEMLSHEETTNLREVFDSAKERYASARKRLKERDVDDKRRVKELAKEKRMLKRQKQRDAQEVVTAQLGSPDDDLESEDSQGYSDSAGSESQDGQDPSRRGVSELPTSIAHQEALALKLLGQNP